MIPSPNPRVCVFGDSHFACVKAATNDGLVEHDDFNLEFWGNVGRRFRHLTWANDHVEPLDEFTAHRFAKFNEHGRTVLNAGDFDCILFVGCRVPIYRMFPELLHRRRVAGAGVSSGVERRILRDFLHGLAPFGFARNFARQDMAKILFAPVPFDTDGFVETIPAEFSQAENADASDRGGLWDITASIMREDGIHLLRQNEGTVVNGCCTALRYATDNHIERNDRTHKNAQYGAIVLNDALNYLRNAAAKAI